MQELRATPASNAEALQLVDVREPDQWAGGHIPGAINLPLHDLQRNLDELDRARPVAFVCNSGFTSAVAASLAKGIGFVQVFNVSGGTSAWREAGFAVEIAPGPGR